MLWKILTGTKDILRLDLQEQIGALTSTRIILLPLLLQ